MPSLLKHVPRKRRLCHVHSWHPWCLPQHLALGKSTVSVADWTTDVWLWDAHSGMIGWMGELCVTPLFLLIINWCTSLSTQILNCSLTTEKNIYGYLVSAVEHLSLLKLRARGKFWCSQADGLVIPGCSLSGYSYLIITPTFHVLPALTPLAHKNYFPMDFVMHSVHGTSTMQ